MGEKCALCIESAFVGVCLCLCNVHLCSVGVCVCVMYTSMHALHSLRQFSSILYFNSHRAIQLFTVFHVIYVIGILQEITARCGPLQSRAMRFLCHICRVRATVRPGLMCGEKQLCLQPEALKFWLDELSFYTAITPSCLFVGLLARSAENQPVVSKKAARNNLSDECWKKTILAQSYPAVKVEN